MDRCEPASALSPLPNRGQWRMLDYEAESFSGVMLYAGPETVAPEVRYPLNRRGWHAVSIGIYTRVSPPVKLLVRLSGADTFSILTLRGEERGRSEELREFFWKIEDLTGQDLVFRQISWRVAEGAGPGSHECSNASAAYIKLVPLSDAEAQAAQEDRRRADTNRLYAHNDAHGFHFGYRPTTAEQVRRQIEPFKDSDFSRLYWESGGGDNLYYFSEIGPMPTNDAVGTFPRLGDRMHAESWRAYRDQGIDPFRVAVDYAHEIGLEFHASWRVAGFYAPPLDLENYRAPFYKYHPELRGVDRSGNRTPRISFTYPEARRFVVSLLREMAQYQIDGVCLLYNRRPPLVEYEPPLIEGFKAEYDEDPRDLDENDRRWLAYRARTLTQFMREVREAMDAVAEEQRRSSRIEVSAIVMSDEEENLANAMDLKAWVDEGLVDTIIPHSSASNLDSMVETWADARDAEWFVSLTRGTSCGLALNLMPRDSSPESYRRRVAALNSAGVEYYFFWDCVEDTRTTYSANWSALRRLGHSEEIEAWVDARQPSLSVPGTELRRLGDWDLSYVTPG